MMNQLNQQLGILPLVRKNSAGKEAQNLQETPAKATRNKQALPEKDQLNKEELRLLVKILKAIGHTCEHQHISIHEGVTHYQLDNTELVFDDVTISDCSNELHLSSLIDMLKDPDKKRPTWEKLKNIQMK